MHAYDLPRTVSLQTLVLIAQVVFLLQHRYTQTDRQTDKLKDATECPTSAATVIEGTWRNECITHKSIINFINNKYIY